MRYGLSLAFCGLSVLAAGADTSAADPVSFSRDVRPILAEHCFRCHGPDEKQRKAELRLDLESNAKHEVDGRAPVVPGSLDRSEVWTRITSAMADERMPPPDSGQKLSTSQIDILRRWIELGAKWEQHWSFVAPRRPSLPQVPDPSWAMNQIDSLIVAKLDGLNLRPAPAADKETLIRRVTLDLTGLPPTLDEIDSFLADESPNAYGKLIDRLLASPRYGERMAWNWLEAARYADTSGYQNDGPRSMWRWRDWVIDAFNSGTPFDQFTIEQVAGDLLPEPTLEQRIATGFNRNHRGNSEGGIIPEEYQVEYVVDRVDTTATVWLGLTMGCGRCHDHKFDPISQREFYRVFAYFNNIPEYGRAIKEGNSPPYITAPTREQQRQLAELESRLSGAERQWEGLSDSIDREQRAWESTVQAETKLETVSPAGQVASFSLDAPSSDSWKMVDGETSFIDGKAGKAIHLSGRQHIEAGDVGNFGYLDKFSVALWVKPDASTGTLISRMVDEDQADGWYLQLHEGHLQVNLVKRWLDDSLRVETEEVIPANVWTHVTMAYDGSRQARGVMVYLNGQPAKLQTRLDLLNQTIVVKEPLRIGGGGGVEHRFAGAVDEVQVFKRTLAAEEALRISIVESVQELVAIQPEKRTTGQRSKIREFFLNRAASKELRAAYLRVNDLRAERQKLLEQLPTVMVMEEIPDRRVTHMLIRGEYNRPGEPITPGIPASLGTNNAAGDRLAFARWLVSENNPLTARVAVNRLWQLHFGAGLVRTTEDFGLQGEPPSHPELLDWLAVELMGADDQGPQPRWDVKALQKLMLNSATYRQASSFAGDAAIANRNPDNRWLARAPRQRLSAEMLRDQALAASGLLVEQLGGPSVKSYQPADLWKDLATDNVYDQDHGAKLYRRSLYTYWKRTVAPPSMTTFDASGREACQVRSPRTNTPLQALTLLNEITFVEAARVMAQRVLRESPPSEIERLGYAFRLATGRRPSEQELKVLQGGLTRHAKHFRERPEDAQRFVKQGEYPVPERIDLADLAALTATCNMLLNLDEVVTRQ